MTKPPRTVFILGAGFTRAFASNAPLLKVKAKDMGLSALERKYEKFDNIRKILREAIDANDDINVEELLTRLAIGMPFDPVVLLDGERRVLLEDIRKAFFDLIEKIDIDSDKIQTFRNFAQYLIDNSLSCITFNYDTFLDEYLWKVKKVEYVGTHNQFFHPDGGYGFFCKPASSLIANDESSMDRCTTLLYKLHGSLNWRVKKGAHAPYKVDDLVHDERWLPKSKEEKELTIIDREVHLDNTPFIINPVLDKSEINSQSVLKTIWSAAYKEIANADKVVFIGYSFPKTDVAAKYLFREALAGKKSKDITVINFSDNKKVKELLRSSYRDIFPKLESRRFIFTGAEKWIKDNCISQVTRILSKHVSVPSPIKV